MNNPLVSIAMITYNHEVFISKAIESVLMQKTDFEFELLISDDASTDNTVEICREYQKKYPNIIRLVAYEKNVGMINNFINAYNSCKGKYMAILDGDDYFIDEYKLQKQADYLENNTQCSLVYTLAKDYFSDNNTFLNTTEQEPSDVDFVYLLHRGWYIRTATVMVRKNVDLESWRNVVKYSYDSLLYFLCALNGSLHKIDDFTAVYRRHSNSVTNSSFGLRVQRMIWYSDLLKDIDKFSLFKYSDEIKKAIKRNNSNACLLALRYLKINFFYLLLSSDISYIMKDIFQRLFKRMNLKSIN